MIRSREIDTALFHQKHSASSLIKSKHYNYISVQKLIQNFLGIKSLFIRMITCLFHRHILCLSVALILNSPDKNAWFSKIIFRAKQTKYYLGDCNRMKGTKVEHLYTVVSLTGLLAKRPFPLANFWCGFLFSGLIIFVAIILSVIVKLKIGHYGIDRLA